MVDLVHCANRQSAMVFFTATFEREDARTQHRIHLGKESPVFFTDTRFCGCGRMGLSEASLAALFARLV